MTNRALLFPFDSQWDLDRGIEEHRLRYWQTMPYTDEEIAEIRKHWNPPSAIEINGAECHSNPDNPVTPEAAPRGSRL